MEIKTGLFGKKNLDILESVIGQLSDGIWENSPAAEKYWRNCEIKESSCGEIIIVAGSWLFWDEENCRKYFATKLKQIVKKELEWSNDKICWNRGCAEVLDYFHGYTTVGMVYFVYDTLLRRNTSKFKYASLF